MYVCGVCLRTGLKTNLNFFAIFCIYEYLSNFLSKNGTAFHWFPFLAKYCFVCYRYLEFISEERSMSCETFFAKWEPQGKRSKSSERELYSTCKARGETGTGFQYKNSQHSFFRNHHDATVPEHWFRCTAACSVHQKTFCWSVCVCVLSY